MKEYIRIKWFRLRKTGKTEQVVYTIKRLYIPLQDPEDMCNLPSANNPESKKERPFPSCYRLVKTHEIKENCLTCRKRMATYYNKLLQRFPTDVALANLSETIEFYQKLALKLKISDVELQMLQRDCHGYLVFHMVYIWKRRGHNYSALYDALKDAGCDTSIFFQIIAEEETDKEKQIVEEIKDKIADRDYYILDEWQILQITKCIGLEYWLLGIRLGICEPDMQHIWSDHRNVNERICVILRKWNWSYRPFREFILAIVRSSLDTREIIEAFTKKSES